MTTKGSMAPGRDGDSGPKKGRRVRLILGPVLAAAAVTALVSSELVASGLAFAWSATSLLNLGKPALLVGDGMALLAAAAGSIWVFRRVYSVEIRLFAGDESAIGDWPWLPKERTEQ